MMASARAPSEANRGDVTSISIREEKTGDAAGIRAVVLAAFGGEDEARLIDALRDEPGFDRSLSLVAERGVEIVGHIMFSAVDIVDDDLRHAGMALAPLAVAPDLQRQGIGTQLVHTGLEACRGRGHGIVLVMGDPVYYRRFGFVAAGPHGIRAMFAGSDEALMVAELRPGVIKGVRGMANYARAFDAFV